MNAADVLDALGTRWPDSEYLKITEAPQDAMRQGRKLDLVAVSLWKSRGYQIDGVEVKVSVSDARKEIDGTLTQQGQRKAGGPEKADWWWHHVHRFWLAAPVTVTEKIADDVPATWGLFAVTDNGKVKVLRKAPHHAAQPMPWDTCIGLMRAAAGAGFNALQRAEDRGERRARERFEKEWDRKTGDAAVRRKLEEITARVQAFEKAAGVELEITRMFSEREAATLGALFNLAVKALRTPDYELGSLTKFAEKLSKSGQDVSEMVAAMKALLAP